MAAQCSHGALKAMGRSVLASGELGSDYHHPEKYLLPEDEDEK